MQRAPTLCLNAVLSLIFFEGLLSTTVHSKLISEDDKYDANVKYGTQFKLDLLRGSHLSEPQVSQHDLMSKLYHFEIGFFFSELDH